MEKKKKVGDINLKHIDNKKILKMVYGKKKGSAQTAEELINSIKFDKIITRK